MRDFTHNTPRYVQIIWFDGVPVAVVDGRDFLDPHGSHRAACFCGRCQWHEDVGASYLPFGVAHVASTDAINLRFPGQGFHAEPSLHQNWMRNYDPTTGRYIQADPLGLVDGASVYGYTAQNPQRYTDPTGEFIPLGAMAAGAAFGAGLAFLDEYLSNDGRLECVNCFNVGFSAGIGVTGGRM